MAPLSFHANAGAFRYSQNCAEARATEVLKPLEVIEGEPPDGIYPADELRVCYYVDFPHPLGRPARSGDGWWAGYFPAPLARARPSVSSAIFEPLKAMD